MATSRATASRTPTRRSAGNSAAPLPKGARIPRPALALWIVRAVVLSCIILGIARPWLLDWATTNQPQATATATATAQPQAGLLTRLLIHDGTNKNTSKGAATELPD